MVGYYEGRNLIYAGSIRAGIPAEYRRALLPHFEELRKQRCPFANLPDRGEGRWGEGLTAAKTVMCRWLEPFIVIRIEFLEWTPDNRLRHPRFAPSAATRMLVRLRANSRLSYSISLAAGEACGVGFLLVTCAGTPGNVPVFRYS